MEISPDHAHEPRRAFQLAITEVVTLDLKGKDDRGRLVRFGDWLRDQRDKHFELHSGSTVRVARASEEGSKCPLWKLIPAVRAPHGAGRFGISFAAPGIGHSRELLASEEREACFPHVGGD